MLVIGLMKGRSVLVFVQIPWQRHVVKCLIEAQNKMEKNYDKENDKRSHAPVSSKYVKFNVSEKMVKISGS